MDAGTFAKQNARKYGLCPYFRLLVNSMEGIYQQLYYKIFGAGNYILIMHRTAISVFITKMIYMAVLCITAFPSYIGAEETVHFQLRWHHQFQFAGYYAAIEKGFYKEEDLNVILHEGKPDKTPVDQVLQGNCLYGEANSELLYERLQGKPLVALAVIFQHSPSVLLVRKSSGITHPQDLIGKTVMTMKDITDADFFAMFQNEGISLKGINIIQSSYNIDDLATGKVDAFNSYETNEPYYLTEKRIPYTMINPRNYGVDFYSDIIFTTEKEIRDHPERVKNFLKATLKGWEYALDDKNEEEIIALLKLKYHVKKSVPHLRYEARTMKKLILPQLVEIGHMNPGRWKHMADIFLNTGLVKNIDKLEGFIYEQENIEKYEKLKNQIIILVIILVFVIAVSTYIYSMNFQLKKEIKMRKSAEDTIREMAFYDPLTKLPNRSLIYDRMTQAIHRSARSKTKFAVCFIDLDNFKYINDTYGHHIGDICLIKIAERIRIKLRSTDSIGRLGGDEFVLILEDVNNKKDIEIIMEGILRSFHEYIQLDGKKLKVSASIGISIYPEDAGDVESLLQIADSAMYKVKNKSKDSYSFY
jgi:diguanylate cyclase (GGDEF)-like protein